MTFATAYEVHPLADLLPRMTDEEFDYLVNGIRENGQRVRIVLYEGKVLDGRHRMLACEQLGIAPLVETYTGDNPAAHVLALNVQRRHLSPTQRAMLATTFLPALKEEARARQAHGQTAPGRHAERSAPNGAERLPGRAAEEAAQIVGVAGRTVERAARILEHAPDLAEQVRDGHLSIGAADKEVTRRQVEQDEAPPLNARGALKVGPSIDTGKGQVQAAAHLRRLKNVEATLAGWCMGFSHLNVDHIRAIADPDEIAQITKSLGASIAELRKLRAELERGRA